MAEKRWVMDECRDHLYLCRKCFLEKKNAADLLERRECWREKLI